MAPSGFLPANLPASWNVALQAEFEQPYFRNLQEFLSSERDQHPVFPCERDVFNAFRLTPLDQVRVVILGQDPYHDVGQAHGLSFSVRAGQPLPPSLRNIFKELQADKNIPPSRHGDLTSWAQQGILLLNTVMTVRAHEPNSHRNRGWEQFTTQVIRILNQSQDLVFILWGKPAQEKATLIDSRHCVIQSPHPSPLSARRGFFGSRPFSKVDEFLISRGTYPINWQLPPATAPAPGS
jgi:uracil-DNA glycosylase